MAFSIGNGFVTATRGRGAARVSINISFKALENWAKRQKMDTPKLMTRSFGRAASGLKKKFYQVIKSAGGVCGVPKFKDFEEFTKELREKSGKAGRPMGGMLADNGSIVAFKRNGWQIVGWPDYLEKAAENFQEGAGGAKAEKYFTDKDYRRMWHRDGLRNIPRRYDHNPRRVIPQPFGGYIDRHLEEWARGAFYKELARQMQKAGAIW